MKRLLWLLILVAFAQPVVSHAGSLWAGYPTTIESPFHRAWRHHAGCGSPTSGITYGFYGAAHERFQHCSMTFSRVYVTHFGTPTATPRPTHTPLPTIPPPAAATRAPTLSPPPTSTPVPATPTAAPTQTPSPQPIATAPPPGGLSTDPTAYELSLMNATRAQYGVAPLSLNATQSAGIGTCVGSVGHSTAMAQSGQIWHSNAAYPSASFPNNICIFYSAAGENVGEGGVFGDPRPMLQQLHNSMMAEGTGNCGSVVSHACNIINGAFHQVGVGIVVQNGAVWLTVDFLS